MSCNACTKSYGFFLKEVGCPNCGFSFCSKCVRHSVRVPRLQNAKHKVCAACVDRIGREEKLATATAASAATPPQSPDRLLAIDPVAEPTVLLLPDVLQPENPDDCIRQRLERLKEGGSPAAAAVAATDSDIAIRIANLKDRPYVDHLARDPAILLATDRRTDAEKTADLLAQFAAEARLNEAADPVADIERRLAALRADTNANANSPLAVGASDSAENETEDMSDADRVKQLVERYMAEAALATDDDVGDGDGELNDDGDTSRRLELTAAERDFVANVRPTDGGMAATPKADELPWCVICNEDAVLRYQGDLFCRLCYREVREDDD